MPRSGIFRANTVVSLALPSLPSAQATFQFASVDVAGRLRRPLLMRLGSGLNSFGPHGYPDCVRAYNHSFFAICNRSTLPDGLAAVVGRVLILVKASLRFGLAKLASCAPASLSLG